MSTPTTFDAERLFEHVSQLVAGAERTLLAASLQASAATHARLTAASRLDDLRSAQNKIRQAISHINAPGLYAASRGPPIDRLPEAILTLVFEWTVSWYTSTTHYNPEIVHPAIIISSVCKRWRSISFAISALWAKVRIVFNQETGNINLGMLSVILDRCKTPRIEVALVSTPSRNWHSHSAIMSLLAQTVFRTRRISLSWGESEISFVGSCLPLLCCNMPSLEELIMAQNDADPAYCYIGQLFSTPKLLTLCPKLVRLDLGDIAICHLDLSFLPNIEVFRTSHTLELSQVRIMCRAWPNLTELTVPGIHPVKNHDPLPVFPKLAVLSCSNRGDSLLHFLPRATLPAVKHLHLEIKTQNTVSAFLGLLQPLPWDDLCTLSLTGKYTGLLSRCVTELPGLTEIRLVHVEKLDLLSILEGWTENPIRYHPPKLRCLKFVSCGFGDKTVHCLFLYLSDRNDKEKGQSIPHVSIDSLVIMYEPLDVEEEDRFPKYMIPRFNQIVEDVSFVDMGRRILHTDI